MLRDGEKARLDENENGCSLPGRELPAATGPQLGLLKTGRALAGSGITFILLLTKTH